MIGKPATVYLVLVAKREPSRGYREHYRTVVKENAEQMFKDIVASGHWKYHRLVEQTERLLEQKVVK